MPAITERKDFFEYKDSTGVSVRFAKVDPPTHDGPGPKPSEILASIRASDPEASAIVQYLPDEVGLADLKEQIIEGNKFDAVEKAVPTWPAKVLVQWHNGQTIKSNSPLYQAIIATGITADELRAMMVEAEKLEAIRG